MSRRKNKATQTDGSSQIDTVDLVEETFATQAETVEPAAAPSAPSAASAASATRVVYIDPTAADGGDGSRGLPFDSWYDVTFEAGTLYLQRGGTTAQGVVVSGQGRADAPIVIASYGEGVARIEGTVVLNGASHVAINGLDIAGKQGLGVYVTGNSSHVTIQGNEIHGGLAGIYLDGASIEGVAISGNRIHDNDTSGIWINNAPATAANPALILGNTIYRNGESGITLQGSHVVVDGNTVVNNGLAGLPGTSAIHVFGITQGDGMGRSNVISNNLVGYQHEPDSFDGHGIQLDHFSGQNVVTGNRIIGNDGPGLTIYSSDRNYVSGNHLEGNGADSGGTRDGGLMQAEIYVANAGWAPGLSAGNLISDNTIVTAVAGTHAVVVTAGAEAAGNMVGENTVTLGTGSSGFAWGGEVTTDLARWNRLNGVDGLDDVGGALSEATPYLDASLLVPGYSANSTLLSDVHADSPNRLVASGGGALSGGSAMDRLAGDDGANVINGLGGADYIAGGAGNDTLFGGSGSDMVGGGVGDDSVFGGDDADILTGGIGNDTVYGGSGADMVGGGAGNDSLFGGTDGDLLTGGAGNDTLSGEAGQDWLRGGDGNDILIGGADLDVLTGGAGADIFTATRGMGGDLVEDFTDGVDRIDVRDLGIRTISQMTIVGGPEATLISFGGENLMVLLKVAPGSLGTTDFIFG